MKSKNLIKIQKLFNQLLYKYLWLCQKCIVYSMCKTYSPHSLFNISDIFREVFIVTVLEDRHCLNLW